MKGEGEPEPIRDGKLGKGKAIGIKIWEEEGGQRELGHRRARDRSKILRSWRRGNRRAYRKTKVRQDEVNSSTKLDLGSRERSDVLQLVRGGQTLTRWQKSQTSKSQKMKASQSPLLLGKALKTTHLGHFNKEQEPSGGALGRQDWSAERKTYIVGNTAMVTEKRTQDVALRREKKVVSLSRRN